MRKIKAKKIDIALDSEGNGKVEARLDLKNGLLLALEVFYQPIIEGEENKLYEAVQYLDKHIEEIKSISPGKKPFTYVFEYSARGYKGESIEEIEGKIDQILSSDTVSYAVMNMRGEVNSYIDYLTKKQHELEKREQKLKKEENKLKKGKYKRSGHLTDQMLKYNHPRDRQPSLFDILQNVTLKDIEEAKIEVAEIVEGIKLSPSETKVIDCLCKMLHEKSENLNTKDQAYYSGNLDYVLVPYGDGKTKAPKLAFTLYELTKEYKGGNVGSGKDVDNVRQILTELNNKHFLLSYVETTRKKDGGRIEKKIEKFTRLIDILEISQTEYSKENVELSKKEDTIIILSPIFWRQIDSKFILYPNDINRRTMLAYGSQNISDMAIRLRDYLMREQSSKHYQPEITLDRLYYLLAEKWMKESRKKKVKEYTEKALETVKALGLLLSYEIKQAATGEPKIVFMLNKSWE